MENNSIDPNVHDFNCFVINVKEQSSKMFELIRTPQSHKSYNLDIVRDNLAIGKPKQEPATPEKPITPKQPKKAFDAVPMVVKYVAKLENVEQDISKFISRSGKVQAGALAPTRTDKFKACNRSIPAPTQLTLNTVNINGGKNHQCRICPKSFTRKQNMLKHMVSHTKTAHPILISRSRGNYKHQTRPDEEHTCQICSKSFKTKACLVQHVKLHTDKPNCRCPVCPSTFETKQIAEAHIKSHVVNYECEICAKIYKRKPDILKHMELHIKATKHKTRICTTSVRKQRKVQVGGGRRCGKNCRRRLKIKKQTLMKEKLLAAANEHACEICREVFRTRRHMLQHMMVHPEKGTYECQFCSKDFKWRQSILRHISLHTDEEKQKPEGCSNVFLTESKVRNVDISSDTVQQSAAANEYHPDFYFVDVKAEPPEIFNLQPTVN